MTTTIMAHTYCPHHYNGPLRLPVYEAAPCNCPRSCCATERYTPHADDCKVKR